MPTLQQVRRYAQLRERIAKPARQEFDRLARGVDLSSDGAYAQLTKIAEAIIMTYGKAAAELGAQWFEFCDPSGKKGAVIKTAKAESALKSAIGYNLSRLQNGEIVRDVMIDALSERAAECVRASAEDTIFENITVTVKSGRASEAKYIRVASADACAFCQTLAANEWTFSSESAASFESHNGCTCTAVPFSGLDDVDGYDATPFQERYEQASQAVMDNKNGTSKYDDELKARIDKAKAEHASKTDEPWRETNERLVVMRYQNDLK